MNNFSYIFKNEKVEKQKPSFQTFLFSRKNNIIVVQVFLEYIFGTNLPGVYKVKELNFCKVFIDFSIIIYFFYCY